ncbi:MAG: hypothetical protein BYD32DRAFT_456457 [Podila humilis]|nr:MAG: hypothetical protein BYD32DRAFT_456457 [Podila humilis]
MERAKHIEYQAIANNLLKSVGESLGERCKNPVLIGVGLGKFGSSGRLKSLHSSFLSYFIPLARSLGYIVVGIEEIILRKSVQTDHGKSHLETREALIPLAEESRRDLSVNRELEGPTSKKAKNLEFCG